jgi:hypothetical protein
MRATSSFLLFFISFSLNSFLLAGWQALSVGLCEVRQRNLPECSDRYTCLTGRVRYRLYPPECVLVKERYWPSLLDARAMFYKLLRPGTCSLRPPLTFKKLERRLLALPFSGRVCVELVQGYQLPLCSDAYTGMMRHDPNFIQHNEEVRQATEVKSQLFTHLLPGRLTGDGVSYVRRSCAASYPALPPKSSNSRCRKASDFMRRLWFTTASLTPISYLTVLNTDVRSTGLAREPELRPLRSASHLPVWHGNGR